MTAKYKQHLTQLRIIVPSTVGILMALPGTALAGSPNPVTQCTKASFFGLVPWYQYLQLNANCDIKSFMFLPDGNQHSDVPLVLLAIVDDLLRIAGIVAVGYIIYGGIQFIISQGSPEGTTKARHTVLNALIGLAIALVAVSVVTFIGNSLGGQ